MSRVVFISHRHADEPIASVLNRHLQKWHLRQDEIFQSSNVGGGARFGGQLHKELLGALSEARLVLLVYTVADADWSYCMWECGVAVDPNQGETPTRIISFRLTEDVPQVLQDLVSVRTSDEHDIKRFVQQFFREKGWVKEDDAFFAGVSDDALDDYARELYSDLLKVTPKLKAEEKRRWDLFTLSYDASSVLEIIQSHQDKTAIGEATIDLIQRKGKVVNDFGQALLHFGYVAKMRDLAFSQLIQRWREEMVDKKDDTAPRDWINEICAELLRAIRSTPAKPHWALMLSRLSPDWWFYPVVNHQRIKADGSMEFDVHLYRLPGTLPPKIDSPNE